MVDAACSCKKCCVYNYLADADIRTATYELSILVVLQAHNKAHYQKVSVIEIQEIDSDGISLPPEEFLATELFADDFGNIKSFTAENARLQAESRILASWIWQNIIWESEPLSILKDVVAWRILWE